MVEKYATLEAFWPFYLREHSKPLTRALHLIGTGLAVAFVVLAIAVANPWFLLGALVSGYAFAWVAHYFVEHNRPATFTYPVKSFVSDWKMFAYFVSGRLGKELERLKLR